MPTKKIEEIEKVVIKVAIEVARSGEGALFVIGDKVSYSKLIKQEFGKLSVFEQGAKKILKGLAVIDGAIVINTKGQLVDYGVMIKDAKPFIGYGTRHAGAMTASKDGNISIMASEEERKVKIFKDGKYIMQVDALDKNVARRVSAISEILESAGAGVIGLIGVTSVVPQIGIALIPGTLIFGGSYYAIKSFLENR